MSRYCPATRFESLKETNKKETNGFLKGNIRNKITATEDTGATAGTKDTGATKDMRGTEDTRETAGAASRWRDLSPSENINTFKTKNNDRRDDDRYNDSRNGRYNDRRNDRNNDSRNGRYNDRRNGRNNDPVLFEKTRCPTFKRRSEIRASTPPPKPFVLDLENNDFPPLGQ